jgi:deoxyribodipyrimidine photolyase-related protein
MHTHEARLARNPRIGMVYKNWQKQDTSQQHAILERAQWCLNNIEKL